MIRRLSLSSPTILALLLALNLASFAQSQATLTRHTRDAVMNGQAALISHLPGNQQMELTFQLPPRNEAALRAFLQEVHDPSSPNYRHFLTVDEFTRMYSPSENDYEKLTQWVQSNNFKVTQASRNHMILQATGSAADVERALHVTMNLYRHPTDNRTFFAPDREPKTDTPMQLYAIGGLDNFSTPHANVVKRDESQSRVHREATTGSCPGAAFCGSDMRAAYYGGTALDGTGQSVGLFEFQGTNLSDVTLYYQNAHQTNTVPINLISVDGASTQCNPSSCDDTEPTLDITQALGMAPKLNAVNVYIGKATNTVLDDKGILTAMATANPLDANLSCSWSWTPTDNTTDDPIFMEMAAQGQNFFVAAGDSAKWPGNGFYWPQDDPFIVSVGGTDLTTTGPGGAWGSETGWADSGGGISPDNFPIPSWQTATAAGCTDCSKTVRNGPDVSANANFTFYVCANGSCTSNFFGGTSFAAPMWAGYLALANQQAVANGQSTLGFINPALYTIGLGSSYNANFHDITSGSNGWPATKGFDLNTGWGSPNGATLINSLTSGGGSADFTISANPNTLTIKRGTSGTSTITTTISNGFNASIALSANIKAAKFNPSTIPAPGAGTSTMTLTVGSNVKTGTHKLTVTGTGGGVTHTTTITVTIQ
ncbi:MAG TPA: S53 family peptidase [Terriglobales bacterium]|nr:S53 family peptidase [Terriglobales bacterium]